MIPPEVSESLAHSEAPTPLCVRSLSCHLSCHLSACWGWVYRRGLSKALKAVSQSVSQSVRQSIIEKEEAKNDQQKPPRFCGGFVGLLSG